MRLGGRVLKILEVHEILIDIHEYSSQVHFDCVCVYGFAPWRGECSESVRVETSIHASHVNRMSLFALNKTVEGPPPYVFYWIRGSVSSPNVCNCLSTDKKQSPQK